MKFFNRTYIIRKSVEIDTMKIIFAVSGILILISGLIAASVATADINEISNKFNTIFKSMD